MKNIAISEAVHKDLKIFAATQGLAMSASVRLLITFWEQNQGRTLAAQNAQPASPQAPDVEGETGEPDSKAEQQVTHYFYS